jgi:hypothetical protein
VSLLTGHSALPITTDRSLITNQPVVHDPKPAVGFAKSTWQVVVTPNDVDVIVTTLVPLKVICIVELPLDASVPSTVSIVIVPD